MYKINFFFVDYSCGGESGQIGGAEQLLGKTYIFALEFIIFF